MLKKRRATPTFLSNFTAYNNVMLAYNDVMNKLAYNDAMNKLYNYNYNGNVMDRGKDFVKEALLDILKKAIMDYERNPMDVYAASTINVFASQLDLVYDLHKGLRTDVHDILKSHFISDLVMEPVIGWKKACYFDTVPFRVVLVKLEIPTGARIVRHLFSNKCRTNKAKILDITNYDGTKQLSHAYSHFDHGFKYTVGDIVVPQHNDFDERPWIRCSGGIHFFETKEEAIEYDFT